ncbi:MAG: MarR family transcriptional regulator [Nitratireductor sp.]
MTETHRALELMERLSRLVGQTGHAHGMKPAQWDALRYLARANRFSRTPGALTAYLGATKGTVSQTVIALERAGLVEKSPHPGDRRSVRLELTPAGRAMLKDDRIEAVRRALARLAPGRAAALEDSLQALLFGLIAEGGGRPFGLCRACRHFGKDAHGPGRHLCRLLGEPLTDAESGQICVEQEAA